MGGLLEPGELKILTAFAAFSLLWLIIFMPLITNNPSFTSLDPIFAYPFFNLGMIILTTIVFGSIFAISKQKVSLSSIFLNGLASWFGISFFADMYQPPYYLDIQGNIIVNNAASASNASVDAFWSSIFNHLIPSLKTMQFPILNPDILTNFGTAPLIINASFLWVAVYAIVPIVAIVVAAVILTQGAFIKVVGMKHKGGTA